MNQQSATTKIVRMQRGPHTFQWRPCVMASWQPRPMNREGRQPQVLDVANVPEHLTPVEVMRLMEQTLWAPSTTSLTRVDFSQLGLGRAVAGSNATSDTPSKRGSP